MTRIDQATEQQIVADYKAGVFYKVLLRKYHLSHVPMKRILERNGVSNSRRPDYSKVPKDKIIEDYLAKMPIQEICLKHSIPRDSLFKIVKKAGVVSPFRLTDEEESFAVAEYENGTPLEVIGEKMGRKIGVIERSLTRNEVERNRRTGVERVDVASAEDLYTSGMSLELVGAHYGSSRQAVRKAFIRNDVQLKTCSESNQRYAVNEHYFSDPNKADVAYFLGFLWADGSNKTQDRCLELLVNSQDEDIIVKLRTALSSTHPTYHFQRELPSGVIAQYSDFQITNQILSTELEALGMVRAKTYADSLVLPKGLSEEMARHFLRGLIDGDGTIFVSQRGALDINLSVLGHIDTLEILSAYILKSVGVRSTIKDIALWNPDRCKTKRLNIGGNRQAVRFLQWLYADSAGIRLDRKYGKYREAISRYFSEIKGADDLSGLNFIHP